MPVTPAARLQRQIVLLVLIALAARIIQTSLGLALLPAQDTVDLLHDDAYYYLGMARSLAGGEGASFGGILTTNGYQWLWQMLLAAQAWLLGNSREALFAITALNGYVLTAFVAVICLWRRDGRTEPFRLALLSGILLAGFAYREVFWHGMESTLFVLLFPWLAACIEGRVRNRWLIAICFVLLPLARLDALSLVGAWYLVLMLRQRRLPTSAQLLPVIAMAVVMIIYALANQIMHGVPVPISGLAKSADSPRFANFGIAHYYLNLAAGLAMAAWAATEWLTRRLTRDRTFRDSIIVFAVATLAQYIYYACLSGWPLWPWYLYLQAGLVMALYARIFVLIPALLQRGRRLAWLLLIGTASLAVLGAVRNVVIRPLLIEAQITACAQLGICTKPLPYMRSYGAANIELATQQHDLLAGRVIAMGDRAGSLGYWMPDSARMLQTEGLVGDKAFLDARLRGQGERFVEAHGVNLFIVDRQNDTRLRWQGREIVALAEPVQGRVTTRGTMYYCFPVSAELSYRRSGPKSHQRVYDFQQRIPCPKPARDALHELETGIHGLRHLAVRSEYGDGSSLMARLEAYDRGRLAKGR